MALSHAEASGLATSGVVTRLSALSLRRPKATLVLALAVIVVLALLGTRAEQRLSPTDIRIKGTPSAVAESLRDAGFGPRETLVALLEGPPEEVTRQGRALTASLTAQDDLRVFSPFSSEEEARRLRPRPDVALLVLDVERGANVPAIRLVPRVEDAVKFGTRAPVRASLTGEAIVTLALTEANAAAVRRAELIAFPLLALVLLLVFGSPLAAAVPGIAGGATVAAGYGVDWILSHFMKLDGNIMTMTSMMGLALGIDYSLLLVARFREALRGGAPTPRDAALTASASAGRTVVLAGGVLVVGMLTTVAFAPGLVLLSVATGVIVLTALSVAVAVFVTPPLLALLGTRIDLWSIRSRRSSHGGHSSWLLGITRKVRRRPVTATLIGAACLLVLGAVAATLRTGTSSAELLPASSPARMDFERIKRQLGSGWARAFEIVVRPDRAPVTDQTTLATIASAQRDIARDPAVAMVIGPAALSERLSPLTKAEERINALWSRLGRGRGELSQLERGLDAGARNLGLLIAGLEQAAGASEQLGDGSRTAGDGAGALGAGQLTAAAGAQRLETALMRLTGGLRGLAGGATDASRGATRLAEAADRANRGAERLRSGANRAASAADDRLAGGADRLGDGLAVGATRLDRLRQPAAITEDETGEALDALRAMSVGRTDPQFDRALRAARSAYTAATGRDPATGRRLREDYPGLEQSLVAAATQAREASAGAFELAAGSRLLGARLRRLAGGVGRLADGSERLARGAGRLRSGLRRLASGGREGEQGGSLINDGVGRLGDGLGELSAGTRALSEGLARLESGNRSLASELREGQARAAPEAVRLAVGLSRIGDFRRGLDDFSRGGGARPLKALPDLLGSGYAGLAAIESARAPDRDRSGVLVDVEQGGGTGRILVVPNEAHVGASALYSRLRNKANELGEGIGGEAGVSGTGARVIDYNTLIGGRLPLLIAALLVTSFLTLVARLRAPILALLAVVFNLAAVVSAFAFMVLAFQGERPLLGGPGYLDVIAVSGMFAVIFGLSMDYQVFLLSRMHEHYREHGVASDAVEHGLRKTASVVTGAAAIMVAVFVAFAAAPFLSIRHFGLGLAAAVVVDATVVRLVLLPAALALLGDRAWWSPVWLQRWRHRGALPTNVRGPAPTP